MNQQTILGQTLNTLLTTKRPHGSETNKRITKWLASILPFDLQQTAFLDGAGNLHVDNRSDTTHRTLFVAHVDTVHHNEGKNRIRKTKTHWHAKGDVLGADDGAGCALLMHMIHSNVRGYYIFTQGEERGGIGARYLATNEIELLKQFDRAIAFDRRGLDSVITHQGWGRCCSDTFGTALCDALMDGSDQLMMLNDDTGIYTDTAEFVDIISECTNISVGYDHEHTQREELNLAHYTHLAKAVLKTQWDALPVERDPSVHESKYDDMYTSSSWYTECKTYNAGRYGYGHDSSVIPWDDDDEEYEDAVRREETIDAVVDAQYGYTLDLAQRIGAVVYEEDIPLVVKHLNFKRVTLRQLADAKKALEEGQDIDAVLTDLFDAAHSM